MGYDGSSDRQREPVDNTLLLDPRPLLYNVSAHEGKAFYGADDHLEKLQSLKAELKKLREDFTILSLHTDNEETMRCLRRKWVESVDSGAAGCAPHGLNLVIGEFWTWSENKDAVDKATALYKHCRNTKIRQALSQCNDGDQRVGVPGTGDTRWTTRRTMCSKLMKWRDDLRRIATQQKWRPYISDDIMDIIGEWRFWDKLDAIGNVVTDITDVIERFEGYISLGKVYYEWLCLLKKYGHFGGGNGQSDRDKFICKISLDKWELMYSSDVLEAFLMDVRYRDVSERIKIGETRYDEREYYNILFLKYSGNREEYNKVREQFVLFREKEGKYAVDATEINEKSPDKVNRNYWKEMKTLYKFAEDQNPMALIKMGLDCVKKPCGIGAVESSFSSLKLIQTPTRAALGSKKLAQLVYIHCNYRFLKHFK